MTRTPEGQLNRLKTRKRAMFGRAGTELLEARLLPIGEIADHRVCG
jgi:transposase